MYSLYILIKLIKNKQYKGIISYSFILLFMICWFSSAILGGSAFNDAKEKYDLYLDGHYYLASHGHYTEVSYTVFMYMKIIEVIGTTSIFFGFVFCLIEYLKFKINKNIDDSNKEPKQIDIDLIDKKIEIPYKENKIFISKSFYSIIKFIIFMTGVLGLLFFAIFSWNLGSILFCLFSVFGFFESVYICFSRCKFTKDKLIVYADNISENLQVQKKAIIKYKDIDKIQIIRLPKYKNTRNYDIDEIDQYISYFTFELDCITITIKNSAAQEGIILNNYTKKQRNLIYNELLRRININT